MDGTYDNFGPVDFVTDDRFLRHHLAPTEESGMFWEAYLMNNPHKNTEYQEARVLLDAVLLGLTSYSRTYLSEEEEAGLLARILHTTAPQEIPLQARPAGIYPGWYRMAAAAIVALAILAAGYMAWRPDTSRKTSYADTIRALENTSGLTRYTNRSATPEVHYLPDSSTVVLAPQSEVSYAADYGRERRNVYLTGRATLDVVPNAKKPFYVYANEIVTKVLGTKFEVVAFDDGSDVTVKVLTGKVTVYRNEDQGGEMTPAVRHPAILLLPNQLVVFDRKAELFDKRLVDNPVSLPDVKSMPKFEYEDSYAIQFFDDITKAYGVNVIYNPELLEGCQFSAVFSDESLPEKLNVVCKTIGATYEIIDAQIVITTSGCKP